MLETASGRKAFSVGKPSPIMMRAARKAMGLRAEQTIMIGDTMETDIHGGVSMGYHTVLVLSGGTSSDDLAKYAYVPDLIVESISKLAHDQLIEKFALPAAPPATAPSQPARRTRLVPA
jgi:NagD protein